MTVRHAIEKTMGLAWRDAPSRVKESTRKSVERAIAQEGDQPYEKDQVEYGQGTRAQHCGICSHFQKLHENGCDLVKGFIEYENWCNKWDEKPNETVFVDQKPS